MTAVAEASRVPARTGSTQPFAGTGTLLRLALRQDRLMLPAWVIVLGAVTVSGASSIEGLYDTAAKRAELAESMATNGSLRAMYGPVFSDSLGGLVAWRFGGFIAVLAAVMSLLIVIRHTREEEETGRQEMLSSAALGRRAPLTAAMLTALIANAGLALIVTLGLSGPTGSATGAFALGLAIAGIGMLFAGMAGIMAQLTESARLARGLTAATLGTAFALRAAGDASATDGGSVWTWLSPLGWAENVRPYAGERWWVLLMLGAAVLVQGSVAYVLAGRRDVGMSFLPTRPGPPEGKITTASGLALRLQRGALMGWTAGFFVAGVVFGGMAEGAADIVGENEGAREIFERMGGQSGLTDAFLAAIIGLCGLVAGLYAVSSVLRLHGEETSQRAEPLLANAVSRGGWAAGHLAIAFGGAAVIMTAAGAGLAIGHGRDTGTLLGAALVLLPAVWLLAALAFLLYGLLPKLAAAAWGVVGLSLAIGWIGPALDLPEGVLNLSPFSHLPKMPGAAMSWPPALILTASAAALVAVGLTALRRRDLHS
ncbi:ABC transporter permease [Streptomyces sp. NPDC051018]|uniref:ABC transporter permease n=1 Tax=Streptomyces sp. NPDC051018 TaxID=3365639 RepID=UPI00379C023F